MKKLSQKLRTDNEYNINTVSEETVLINWTSLDGRYN